MNDLIEKLTEELERAKDVYKANGKNDYDAGRYEGLKQALEIVVAEIEKI